jgi:hypothetical protein
MAKKMEVSHTSQILTNDHQILVPFKLSNYYCRISTFEFLSANDFMINLMEIGNGNIDTKCVYFYVNIVLS